MSGRCGTSASSTLPLDRPQVVLYGEPAYPDLDTKAAALLESIVRNHALVDGNKRLGWLATVVCYGLHDVTLDAPDDDAYELVMAVARSEPAVESIAAALRRLALSLSCWVSGQTPATQAVRKCTAVPVKVPRARS